MGWMFYLFESMCVYNNYYTAEIALRIETLPPPYSSITLSIPIFPKIMLA